MKIFWIYFVVFSTYVEVILNLLSIIAFGSGILHVCGGDPDNVCAHGPWRSVFSTYVEVIPRVAVNYRYNFGILHVCGGDPPIIALFEIAFWYSPRMWR